jgi:HAD superfamily hydrolase (TIGR01509 family)
LTCGTATAHEMDAYKRVAYLRLFKNVTLVPDSLAFLAAARRVFRKLGLATSATRRDLGMAERKYRFSQWFDVIFTGEDTIAHKPDPEPHVKSLAALGVAGQTTLVVEDSSNGIMSAEPAHCKVAALTTAFRPHELCEAGAGVVVASFAELGRELGLVISK